MTSYVLFAEIKSIWIAKGQKDETSAILELTVDLSKIGCLVDTDHCVIGSGC